MADPTSGDRTGSLHRRTLAATPRAPGCPASIEARRSSDPCSETRASGFAATGSSAVADADERFGRGTTYKGGAVAGEMLLSAGARSRVGRIGEYSAVPFVGHRQARASASVTVECPATLVVRDLGATITDGDRPNLDLRPSQPLEECHASPVEPLQREAGRRAGEDGLFGAPLLAGARSVG